jgi:hypothetical protein
MEEIEILFRKMMEDLDGFIETDEVYQEDFHMTSFQVFHASFHTYDAQIRQLFQAVVSRTIKFYQ